VALSRQVLSFGVSYDRVGAVLFTSLKLARKVVDFVGFLVP
jgi:hypothetical protein